MPNILNNVFTYSWSFVSLTSKPKYQNIKRLSSVLVLLFSQLTLLIIFIGFTEYAPEADASDRHNSQLPVEGGYDEDSDAISESYAC